LTYPYLLHILKAAPSAFLCNCTVHTQQQLILHLTLSPKPIMILKCAKVSTERKALRQKEAQCIKA